MVNAMRSPMSMGFGNSNFGYPQNGMGMNRPGGSFGGPS
jgi:hypothetical protein